MLKNRRLGAQAAMNLSDLVTRQSHDAAGPDTTSPVDAHALVAQLGSEVASSLSSALERVTTLAATGQIDRDGLRELREEIELARHAGIMGQQLGRLGKGQFHLAPERIDLSALLREALHLRQRELKARGITVRETFAEVELVNDTALTFSLIETLLEWAFAHTGSRVVLRLDVKTDPARARLSCAFLRRRLDEMSEAAVLQTEDPALNTVGWRLLQQTATVLGLRLRRRDTPDRCELRLTFPDAEASAPIHTVPDELHAAEVSAPVYASQSLAGRHVVVLVARREVRNIVRDTLKPMELMLDFVASLEEAQQLFKDALPHAVIYEASLGGDRFERLRSSLLAEAPSLAFIQIAEHEKAFEVLESGGHPFASVGRDSIAESLPEALLFELSRHG